MAPLEEKYHIVYAFFQNIIHHGKDFYFLLLIIPTFIGDFQFQKDVLKEEGNLHIKEAEIKAFFRKKIDYHVDNIRKADVI